MTIQTNFLVIFILPISSTLLPLVPFLPLLPITSFLVVVTSLNSHLLHQQRYSSTSIAVTSIDIILSQRELNRRIQQDTDRRERLLRRNQDIMADDAVPPAAAAVDPAIAALLDSNNTNSLQLNATLQALLNHFATPSTQVHDLFESPDPFNLGTRSGLTAYEQACKPLPSKWNGGSSDYPTLIIELIDKARDCKWDATNGTGIITIPQDGTDINILSQTIPYLLTRVLVILLCMLDSP